MREGFWFGLHPYFNANSFIFLFSNKNKEPKRGTRRYSPSTVLVHSLDNVISGGAGGNRTLVQTGKPYAFYTLIPVLIFEYKFDPDRLCLYLILV